MIIMVLSEEAETPILSAEHLFILGRNEKGRLEWTTTMALVMVMLVMAMAPTEMSGQTEAGRRFGENL